MQLSILYRGPLSSCNYSCDYCPFAKHRETRAELVTDRIALERFVDWVAGQGARGHEISVLFTPWGEALVRRWYQVALARLTAMAHVRKAAVQTNLSCSLDWTESCDHSKLGLWCTFHPGQTSRARFLAKCRQLDSRGVGYSVGVVGLQEHFGEIEALRTELPPEVYLWVNAFKRRPGYYGEDDLERLKAVDPLFPVNNTYHPSRGRACRTGHSVFSVDGSGVMRRCHFITEPIGSIYAADWESRLRPSACSNTSCGCHIGYVHMPELGLYEVFGDAVLERRLDRRFEGSAGS